MTHTAHPIKHVHVSNGAIAVTHRCCGDPHSDSVSTIYVDGTVTPEQFQAKLDIQKQRVEAEHQAMKNAKAILDSLLQPQG